MKKQREEGEILDFAQEVAALIASVRRGALQKLGADSIFGDLTVPQYIALEAVQNSRRMKMKDIASQLKTSLPAATGVISRLHKLGMVKRSFDPKDRRIVYIELTKKGVDSVNRMRKKQVQAMIKIFGILTKKEREIYLSILRKVNSNIYRGKK